MTMDYDQANLVSDTYYCFSKYLGKENHSPLLGDTCGTWTINDDNGHGL